MRLLNTSTIKLEEFMAEPPRYAILSHTWGESEALFADIQNNNAQLKTAYAKILDTCRLAKSQGYHYVWVDTCCIDKSSSAELSEAINSMFAYYRYSGVCYVYLDIELPSGEISAESLRESRWTYRGWTLQELIAPQYVQFYDKKWKFIGTGQGAAHHLAEVTNIPPGLLCATRSSLPFILQRFSIADRMSWAANRQTTRPEDVAYCLFGLFDVHLPLLYGEGADKAFLRLQGEIMRTSMDLSILAWSGRPYPHPSAKSSFGLAHSPTWFSGYTSILFGMTDDEEPFKMTNKGLRVRIPLIKNDWVGGTCTAVLRSCRSGDGSASLIGVRLRSSTFSTSLAIEQNRSVWHRDNQSSVDGVPVVHPLDKEALNNAEIHKVYIQIR